MRSYVYALLGLGVSALFFLLLYLRTDLTEFREALAGVHYPYLLLASLFYALALSFRAVRWHLLLRPLRVIPPYRVFPIITIGEFANHLLPLRMGELMRAYLVSTREQVRAMASLGTIAVERLMDGVVLLGMLVVAALILNPEGPLRSLVFAAALLVALLVASVFFMVWQAERLNAWVRTLAGLVPRSVGGRLVDLTASFLEGVREALKAPGVVAGAAVCSLAVWLSEVGLYLLVGRAFGLEEGIVTYLLVLSAANLAIALPSSQGGIGPFEFFGREALVFANVAGSVATAYMVALRVVVFGSVVFLGLISLWALNQGLWSLVRVSTAPTSRVDEEQ